ncbi:MAG: class I SAM-dependent methyltransferase [Treponema sp.]|nr:class I SAM-dependent methyltransferase [Treponema sp.]
MNEKTALQSQMFENRLQKRFRHLKKWAQRADAGVFRLYDRDIPEIPLVLDFYGDCAHVHDAVISGALYKRPYEKDKDEEEQWLSAMKAGVSRSLGIETERVFLKQRERQRGSSQYEKLGSTHFTKIVSEKGLSFKVNLSDYLDCGLFPDRRLLRAIVRGDAGGKKILNLFSYTGSFSVYAVAGGAVSTDSVDLSNTYLSWARENFSLNGFSAQMISYEEEFFAGKDSPREERSINRLIRADVLSFLDKAVKKGIKWDMIIVDPPAFSNSKKMTDSFDLRRDLINLLEKALALLATGGKIFLSVNARSAAIKASELETELAVCSKNVRVIDIESKIMDEDFRGRKAPKAFEIGL